MIYKAHIAITDGTASLDESRKEAGTPIQGAPGEVDVTTRTEFRMQDRTRKGLSGGCRLDCGETPGVLEMR